MLFGSIIYFFEIQELLYLLAFLLRLKKGIGFILPDALP
jgi:hypothetical protein